MTHSSVLADLIDLNEVLDADPATDLEQRRQRDRSIGRKLQSDRDKPVSQIRAWLHAVDTPAARSGGVRGVRLYHALCLALLVAGLLTGWGLASAVLFYEGRQPINIVNAVAVLVLPQILLLFAWLLAALPLPLFRHFGSTLGFLHPGRLAGHLAGVFSNRENAGLAIFWNPDNVAVLAPAARWLLSFWSQLFACSYNIGILVSAFYLVSFSDLAFVWSTTLTVSDASFHQLVTVLATPWSAWFPEAVPGAELIANSRYYRLDESSPADIPLRAVELGQWWPFLIAAVTCYGLLPRVLTLAFSWYRFHHHLRRALCNLPGAPELLARMNSPLVLTTATQPEHALPMPGGGAASSAVGHYAIRCPVIAWSGACAGVEAVDALLAAMGIEALELLRAGGRQTPEQDRELVDALCRRKPEGVCILVKAWEPPMLDFLDFTRGMRRQCGGRKPLIVILCGAADGVRVADRDTWQLTLGQLADPDLHVETIGQTA